MNFFKNPVAASRQSAAFFTQEKPMAALCRDAAAQVEHQKERK
jgi:hypothetical protein